MGQHSLPQQRRNDHHEPDSGYSEKGIPGDLSETFENISANPLF